MKNTIELVCTVLLTFVLLLAAGKVLDPFEAEYGVEAIKAFHMLENDSCDVIVYGSSHAWKGCDTKIMYDKYGISAYNYGCNWQNLDTTLLFLRDSFRTQSPKLVCIETYTIPREIMEDMDMDGQIYYTRAMSWFSGKLKYIHKCFGKDLERYASYVFPIIVFHDNWDKVTDESFREKDPKRFLNNRGFFDNDVIWDQQEIHIPPTADFYEREGVQEGVDPFVQFGLGEPNVEVLDQIVAECRAHNTQILFYTIPYEGTEPFKDAIQEYCDDNQIIYLDMFDHLDALGLDLSKDLSDPKHLNKYGAAKVGDMLGKFIVYSYGFGHM